MTNRLNPFQASFLILLSPKGWIDIEEFRNFMSLEFGKTNIKVFLNKFNSSVESLKRRKLIDSEGMVIRINENGKKALKDYSQL